MANTGRHTDVVLPATATDSLVTTRGYMATAGRHGYRSHTVTSGLVDNELTDNAHGTWVSRDSDD